MNLSMPKVMALRATQICMMRLLGIMRYEQLCARNNYSCNVETTLLTIHDQSTLTHAPGLDIALVQEVQAGTAFLSHVEMSMQTFDKRQLAWYNTRSSFGILACSLRSLQWPHLCKDRISNQADMAKLNCNVSRAFNSVWCLQYITLMGRAPVLLLYYEPSGMAKFQQNGVLCNYSMSQWHTEPGLALVASRHTRLAILILTSLTMSLYRAQACSHQGSNRMVESDQGIMICSQISSNIILSTPD